MKITLIVIVCVVLQAQKLSKTCTCSQINQQEQCDVSPKCFWSELRCYYDHNYIDQLVKPFDCSYYSQLDCRVLPQCAFYLGQCKSFTDCSVLLKESCNFSSSQCVPDGRTCVKKGICESYLTQVACGNKDVNDKYCFWENLSCLTIEKCEQLPKSLNTEEDCRTEMTHCTLNIAGGCTKSPESCEQHKLQEQCHFNYDQSKACFWDPKRNQCFEKLCLNAQFPTHNQCELIESNCTTDGQKCIKIGICSEFQVYISCVKDMDGNPCVFQNNKCSNQVCTSASLEYTLLEECLQYLRGTNCVPQKNGGCKPFPDTCPELETFGSCIKLQDGIECHWGDNNRCKLKECSDAPMQFAYSQCQQWLTNCIGRLGGGCTIRPNTCEEINDPQSCDYSEIGATCYFDKINQKCKELICSNLNLPEFDSDQKCQEQSSKCRFDQAKGGCFDFYCSNITESSKCFQDYKGFPCNIITCVNKDCYNGPNSLTTNLECEQWHTDCTVHHSGYGCEYKKTLCNEHIQIQCSRTLNYNQCIWKDLQCQDKLCTDAPLQSYTSHESCLNEWKALQGKCTLADSGQGCQSWPSTCIEITLSSLCLIGTVNGESCSWFNNQCYVKDCSNAPQNYKSISQCSKWLINCTFNDNNQLCVDKSTIQCESKNTFTTHTQCNEWNSNCTIAPRILGQGCEQKRQCSEYKQESQCQKGVDGASDGASFTTSYGFACYWDTNTSSCSNINCGAYQQSNCTIGSKGQYCVWFNDVNNVNGSYCKSQYPACSDCGNCLQCQQLTGSICIFLNNQCQQLSSQYNSECNNSTQQNCENNQASDNKYSTCFWNNNSCFTKFCSNYNGTTFTLNLCQSWLPSCTINPLSTACINKVNCKQAPKSFTTHSDCQSYLPICTISRNQPTCVSLPSNCTEATDIQCYLDASGNKCYWSFILNECIQIQDCNQLTSIISNHSECQQLISICYWNNLVDECQTLVSCDQIDLITMNHQDCQSLLPICTVNSNLLGCTPLSNCSDYTQDQCYIAMDQTLCVWYESQCQNKSCFTADLNIYTNLSCREYFGSTCSVLQAIGTKCIESPKKCSEYNQSQCLLPDSQNFYGIPCTKSASGECIERLCGNAPQILSFLSTQEHCNLIFNSCIISGCRDRECRDFESISQQLCEQALPKAITCTSGSIGCKERGSCESVLKQYSCNHDNLGRQCEWVNDQCSIKNCYTAPIYIRTLSDCDLYYSGCIPKRQGGCMERLTCPLIQVDEACNIDSEGIECNWNQDSLQCQYSECRPVCGDGILSLGFEECDDGNLLPYDGCYQCKFQCEFGCELCYNFQCQQCAIGWILKQKCETMCGDGEVVGQEECDDMNLIPYDGCFECKFQCSQQCEVCQQGVCQLCKHGWHQYDSQCASKCGDGILVHSLEECDDGNNINEDGCSKECKLESGWFCEQNSYEFSECIYSELPEIILTQIIQGQYSEFTITFSQELKYNKSIDVSFEPLQFIKGELLDQNLSYYQLIINQHTNYNMTNLNSLQFQIQLNYLQPIVDPKLVVYVNQYVFENYFEVGLSSLTAQLKLQAPKFLTQNEKQIALNTAQFNSILIYSLLSISIIGVLLGNMDIFWNLLDNLQFLSYIRYINVEYPENLGIFLEVFNMISVQPILDFLQVDQILTMIYFGEMPFIDSFGKFKVNNLNTYFLYNITNTILAIMIAYVSYYICWLILRFFNPLSIDGKLEQIGLPVIWRMRCLKLCRFFTKICLKTVRFFMYNTLIRIFISSCYDIIFSIMLQLSKMPKNNNNPIYTLSYIISCISMLAVFWILFKMYSIIRSDYCSEKNKVLLENLKINSTFTKHYQTYQLIKKILFIFFLIFLQDQYIIQNIMISYVTMINLVYLSVCQPFQSSTETIKLILIEFSVVINTISITISSVFFENSVMSGWIIIVIYSVSLCATLLIDISIYVLKMYKYCTAK